MAKPEWGSKHTCEKCGTRFYDLRRVPAVCPTCGTEWSPHKGVRPKREPMPVAVEAAVEAVAEAVPPEAAEAEAAEAPDDEVEEGADVAGNDPDLAEDEAKGVGATFPERKE